MVVIILFFLASIFAVLVAPATVTITDAPAYQTQRSCAKYCFDMGVDWGAYGVARQIDCDSQPIENDCFCRGDLQSEASKYIRSCVSSNCDQKTIDVDRAVGIYTDYCTSNGFTAAAAPTGTQGHPQTVTVTVIQRTTLAAAASVLQAPLAALAAQVKGFLR
jgi:hypothetical protein